MARRGASKLTAARKVDYRNLVNPFPTMDVFSADEIANMHDTALRALEDLGVRVLLPEARDIFRQGGARVDGEMVHIGREMVEAALAVCSAVDHCPRRSAGPGCDVLALGRLVFQPGAGRAACDRSGTGDGGPGRRGITES